MDVDASNGARAQRLARFALNTMDIPRLVWFYERAFGARVVAGHQLSGHNVTLRLGVATLDMLRFNPSGRPYPRDLPPFEAAFQHLAIVVSDMSRAFERLSSVDGWKAISTHGPQRLPVRSGGVTAFKFRDPDGHPLELLAFPDDKLPTYWRGLSPHHTFLGVDHSALSVTDLERSRRFYEGLGLTAANQTRNVGVGQQLLDGIIDPVVDVMTLEPVKPTPHVELLHYRNQVRSSREPLGVHDIAAVRLIFERQQATCNTDYPHEASVFQDPDGHFIQLIGSGENRLRPGTSYAWV